MVECHYRDWGCVSARKCRRVGNSHLWLDPEGIVAVVDEEEGINLVEGMEPETRRCRCGCRGV